MTRRNDIGQLEEMYLRMLRIRAFETGSRSSSRRRRFAARRISTSAWRRSRSGCARALRDDDYITSTHRGHGHCIAKGLELRPMMAEILGRATGYCRGKGGSMHITALGTGCWARTRSSAVRSRSPWAQRTACGCRGRTRVAVAFFGDGAINQGLFHEAANLGRGPRAPVVFVCENNQWAISTPIETVTRIGDLATRAEAYGFPGEVVDGNDVVAVRDVAGVAVERARAGGGPTLIEAKSFRVRGHSASSRRRPLARADQRVGETRPDRAGGTPPGRGAPSRPRAA